MFFYFSSQSVAVTSELGSTSWRVWASPVDFPPSVANPPKCSASAGSQEAAPPSWAWGRIPGELGNRSISANPADEPAYRIRGKFFLDTNDAKPFGRSSRPRAIVSLAPRLPIAYKLPPNATRQTSVSRWLLGQKEQYDQAENEDNNALSNNIDRFSLT